MMEAPAGHRAPRARRRPRRCGAAGGGTDHHGGGSRRKDEKERCDLISAPGLSHDAAKQFTLCVAERYSVPLAAVWHVRCEPFKRALPG